MDKREALINYFMDHMLDNPETIRDALECYFNDTHDLDINDLYNDLIG